MLTYHRGATVLRFITCRPRLIVKRLGNEWRTIFAGLWEQWYINTGEVKWFTTGQIILHMSFTGTGMLNYASVLRLLYNSVLHLSRWIPRVKINWILCWAVFLIKFKVAGKFFHSWTCRSNCKITGIFGTESIAICSVVVVFLQRKVKTYYLAWKLLNLWKGKWIIQGFLCYHKFFLTLQDLGQLRA